MIKLFVRISVISATILVLGSCQSLETSSGNREPAQSRATKSSDLLKMNTEQLASELIEQAKVVRQTLPTVGSFRGQLLNHFIDSAQRRRSRYPQNSAMNIWGLYGSLQKISTDAGVAGLMGVESKETLEMMKFMDLTAAQISEKSIVDAEARRIYEIAGQVSYLRFLMNRVTGNLRPYVDSLPTGPGRLELSKLYNSFLRLKGNITYLSRAMNVPKEFSTQLNYILRDPVWLGLKKVYIPLAGSSDIEGMAKDLEMAESIRLGVDSMYLLISSLQKQAPLQKPINVTNFEIDDEFLQRKPAQEADEEAVTSMAAKMPAMKYANLILIGYVPGEYLGKDKNSYALASVEVQNRLITKITELKEAEVAAAAKPISGKQILVLKSSSDYDVIYPGFIDLHNHTKQNNLPVWGQAKGQFENRFEWRGWGDYTKSVSQNMNPWIGFGKPIECAAFRWSELKTMILGTTYLQGPSNCVENFSIQRVEDGSAYVSPKSSVQAPTDLIYPNEMQFVWSVLRPLIQTGQTYEQALANTVNRYCPGIQGVAASTVNEAAGLKILKDQALLKASCPEPLPKGFIRYIYWIHPTVAGKKNYLKSPNYSAVIAHLAEGRRRDPYNMREMELVQMLGLDMPHMNFVHGVGVTPAFLPRLASKEMGLIWSPFSNLLLYAETMDILAAAKAGVRIALGSDWLPTGSKGVLEEIKLAAQYVDKDPSLRAYFSDELLYKMITENPARMINHWEIKRSADGKVVEAGVGQIAEGAMGSLVVATKQHENPYTNIVRQTQAENINLVVIDGNIVYGNEEWIKQAGISRYEIISEEYAGIEKTFNLSSAPKPPTESGKDLMAAHLVKVGVFAAGLKPPVNGTCKFNSRKAFVTADTVRYLPELAKFKTESGLDLDKFTDIKKLLAVAALTQSKNMTDPSGDPKFALTYFPPLYSCDDPLHTARISGMVNGRGPDEWTTNVSNRSSLRSQQKLGRLPQKLGEAYQ